MQECLVQIDIEDSNFIPYEHLFGYFIQFLIFRKGSSFVTTDEIKLCSNIEEYMNNHDSEPEGLCSLFYNRVETSLMKKSNLSSLLKDITHCLSTTFKERLPYTKFKSNFIEDRYIIY
jgi:hypothetical protein